jgi:hypothetical protein
LLDAIHEFALDHYKQDPKTTKAFDSTALVSIGLLVQEVILKKYTDQDTN